MSTLEGLSHLAEAATALANLTCCASLSASAQIHISQAQRLQSLNVTKPSARRRVVKDAEGDAKNYPFATAFAAGNVKEIFPERLMAMMNNKSLADIITWLPHGRSFQILRPDVFSEFVLPKYLPPVDSRSSTKYPSFTRKMNRWGFRQATRGPDTGAFHHPLFQRDKPELCLEMVCERTRGSTGTKKRNVPAKKRRIDFLTKESLDAMNKESPTSQPPLKPHTAVSVSDDGNSLKSNVSAPFSPAQPLTVDKQLPLIPHATQSITDNNDLVQRAITQRNEEERMRVAKAMLYNAFLAATKQEK